MSASCQSANWPDEFAKVVGCTFCSKNLFPVLRRDEGEDVPQPGYIGRSYWKTRVVLVGQNPAVPPPRLAEADRPYTAALRALRDNPTQEKFRALQTVLMDFIPHWPVHEGYFPLAECGLSLNDIAYCNLVRCRTTENRVPGGRIAARCAEQHFARWLDLLAPRVVIFIGKWAHDKGMRFVSTREIPCSFMNRQRSLSTENRRANRAAVVALVKKHRDYQEDRPQ